MFEPTDTATLDQLETELVGIESLIARCRARQLTLLRALESRGVAALDGARTMTEWTAARLDVTRETARVLVNAARRVPDHADLDHELDAGLVSFDRAAAMLGLAAAGADETALEDSRGLDLGGVSRLTARHKRLSADQERCLFRDRYVAIQPSLDQTQWRLHGRLPGSEGAVVAQALTERGDALHSDPGHRGSRPQRGADALVSMAMDALDPPIGDETASGSGRVPLLSVFVDAALAAASGGEAGAELAAGPRVGPVTLERLLCDGAVEVNLTGAEPLATAPQARVVPPRLRRSVLHRDGGCVIGGCHSRYRLQIHHVVPVSAGGLTRAENLVTACWFHHHVVIHGRGMQIDPDSPPCNRRFLRPAAEAHPT